MKQSFDPINADPISDELWSNHSTSSMLIMLMTSYEEINEGLIDALVLRKYSFGNWIIWPAFEDIEIQKPSLPILEPAVFIGGPGSDQSSM